MSHRAGVLAAVLVVALLCHGVCADLTPQQDVEVEALHAMFDALGGNAWTHHDDWKNADVCFCKWFGVTCGATCHAAACGASCHVEALELPHNNLRGELPAQMTHLAHLTTLKMEGNHISGAWPAWLAAHSSLHVIHLNDNALSDGVPDLSALGVLSELHIARNLFSRSLSWLGTLAATVSVVDITANQFTGALPDLSGLVHLHELHAGSNLIDGELPPSLSALGSLEVLVLEYNALKGALLDVWEHTPRLRVLNVRHNSLAGALPLSLHACPKLEVLQLDYNALGPSLGTFWESLPALMQLSAHGNKFSDVLPPSLGTCVALQVLDMGNNGLTGPVPDSYGNLVKLKSINLANNHLHGALPPRFGNTYPLLSFDVSGNNLDGPLVSLADAVQLVEYDASSNAFTGPIPESLVLHSKLNSLILNNNHLHGELPKSLGEAEALNDLNVANNQLSGSLPSFERGMLGELVTFFAQHNRFEGAIPPALGRHMALRVCDLSFNELSGVLPSPFVAPLTQFFVQHNKLRGSASNPVPQFAAVNTSSLVLDNTRHFLCAELVGKSRTMLIDIDASYFAFQYCWCTEGFYRTSQHACTRCPVGAVCPGLHDDTIMAALPGYYSSPDYPQTGPVAADAAADVPRPTAFLQCTDTSWNHTSCNPDGLLVNGNVCERGYTGRKCSRCASGYYLWGRRCVACNASSQALVVVLYLFALIVLCAYVFHPPAKRATVRVMVFYFQCMSLLPAVGLSVPVPSFMDFLQASSASNFELMAAECVDDGFDFRARVYTMVVLPLIMGGAVFLIWTAGWLRGRVQRRTTYVHTSQLWMYRSVRAFLLVLVLMYLQLCRTIFSSFRGEHDAGTHTSYVAAAPYMQQHGNRDWNALVVVASFGLFVYVVGVPAIIAFLVRRFRRGRGEDHGQYILSQFLGFVYEPYTDEAYYWEAVITGRKMLVALVIAVVPLDKFYFPMFVFAILAGSIALQKAYMPYRAAKDNQLELISLVLLFFNFYTAIVYLIPQMKQVNTVGVVIFTANVVFIIYAAYEVMKTKASENKVVSEALQRGRSYVVQKSASFKKRGMSVVHRGAGREERALSNAERDSLLGLDTSTTLVEEDKP